MIAKETVYKKVKKIVTEILNLELDDIRDEKIDKVSLEEYGYNSIDALEVLVALEEGFQIQINDENLNFEFLQSITSITDYIFNQLQQPENKEETTMKNKSITIGIAGGSGSGKSTFCKKLQERLNKEFQVKTISTDQFFVGELPKMVSPATGKEYDDWNAPGAVNHEGVEQAVKEAQGEAEVILVEGSSVLYFEELRKQFDLKIFLDLDSDERMYRRIKRNMAMWNASMEEVADYYLESAKFSEKKNYLDTKMYADLVLNGRSDHELSTDMIQAWVSSRLKGE
ncbi:MAG TPA: AAA family ATPase [Firmicutes bacterium]|nr:AAA family ATPase [Bacillota bacterium]